MQQEIAAISTQHQEKASDSDPADKSKKKKKEKKEKQPAVPIHKLFRFATPIEAAMVLTACLLSAAVGAIQPLSIIIFGQFLGNIGTSLSSTQDFEKLARDTHPLVLTFVYMGTGVLIAAYTTHCFWVLSGELQVRRIRTMYVHAILRQDMGWFDKAEEGSLTTRLATDTQLIQEGNIFVAAVFTVSLLTRQQVSVKNSVCWSCASVSLSLVLLLPSSRVGN